MDRFVAAAGGTS